MALLKFPCRCQGRCRFHKARCMCLRTASTSRNIIYDSCHCRIIRLSAEIPQTSRFFACGSTIDGKHLSVFKFRYSGSCSTTFKMLPLIIGNRVWMTSEPPPTIVGPSLCGRNGFLMSSRPYYIMKKESGLKVFDFLVTLSYVIFKSCPTDQTLPSGTLP